MGMPITVDVRDSAADAAAFDAVFAELRDIDELFSPFKIESAISRINDGRLAPGDAPLLVREVLALCAQYERRTRGFFSPWHAGRLDPSGLVKGWALGRAAAILDGRGYRDYFIDGAGDVWARGHSASRAPWRVGIRHPVERDKVVRVVLASDLAVATSGTYEKGEHIYDPHTGLPTTALLSMSVVGPSIVDADVFATAAFAMGPEGLDLIESEPGYEAYAIDRDLRATWTTGFDALCAR